MQFMKRKSIACVLLITMLMSWTGIAFAFMPATSIQEHALEHSIKKTDLSSSHCKEVVADLKHMSANDNMPCSQDQISLSNAVSHNHCQDCATPQCQISVFNISILQEQQFALDKLVLQADRNFNYIASNSSDFRQDILRPPQA